MRSKCPHFWKRSNRFIDITPIVQLAFGWVDDKNDLCI